MSYQDLITVRTECFLDTALFLFAGLPRTEPGKSRGRSPWPFFAALLIAVAFASSYKTYLVHREGSNLPPSSVGLPLKDFVINHNSRQKQNGKLLEI